jgi:hypothetical protein
MVLFYSLAGHAVVPGAPPPASDQLRSLSIDGYFDPERNFLDATAKLNFAIMADERRLWLAEELDLRSMRSGARPAVYFKRECGQFLVLSPGEKDLEMRYSGRLHPYLDLFEAGAAPGSPAGRAPIDDYRFLSYVKDFYPNPRIDFTPLSMRFSVPKGWNCLGSGRLCSIQSQPEVNTFQFDNSEAKGMALVCGRFSRIGTVGAAIPLKLHGGPGFAYERFFSAADMAGVISFYRERFGPLQVPELNVLFRRGSNFGGVSYNGLIVLNVDEYWASRTPEARSAKLRGSPLSLIDPKFDLLAHEMAHQWWGGLISWKSAADNWITEGLATYATLLFLRERQGEKAYRKALANLRHWLKKFGSKGVSADGFKLKLRNRDLRVYQTLVYVKPALMLAELADALGEGGLCLRLKGILAARRSCNVDTEEFLDLLSAGDGSRRARLAEWIHGLGLPPEP